MAINVTEAIATLLEQGVDVSKNGWHVSRTEWKHDFVVTDHNHRGLIQPEHETTFKTPKEAVEHFIEKARL